MSLWAKIFGHKKYRQFVVICHARTGSNLLLSYLKSHPNIKMHDEIFKVLQNQSIDRIYSVFYKKKPHRIRVSGFKLFYNHPEDGDNEKVLQLIERIPDVSIIHLTRNDKLATLVSWKIALQTDIWGIKEGTPLIPLEKKKISITPQEVLKFFNSVSEQEQEIENRFKHKHYLRITYEDMAEHPEVILKAILSLLNVPVIPLKTSYIKLNPESIQDLVVNYHELVDHGIIEKSHTE